MNEQSQIPAGDDDPRVIEQLARLRGSEPSPRARANYHLLVQAELQEISGADARSWWRRSVRVPVPVCMAASLVIVALLFWRTPLAIEPLSAPAVSSPRDLASHSEPRLRTTSTYLLGVGEITTKTHYYFSENER